MISAARKKQLLDVLNDLSARYPDIKKMLDLTVGVLCVAGVGENVRMDARRALEQVLDKHMEHQDAFDTAKTIVEMIELDGKDGGKVPHLAR